MIDDCFAERERVKIHYLKSGGSSDLTPPVYLPGFGRDADSIKDEVRRFHPRQVFGVGNRGVGKSSVTKTGYSFESRVGDLAAVIENAALEPFCLMSFSMGVPVALGYALEQPENLKGLILLDYRAQYPKLPKVWTDGVAQTSDLSPEYIFGTQLESNQVNLWSKLPSVSCPVRIIRGGKSGALSAKEGEKYVSLLPNARQIIFGDSGHEVYKPDYERFVTTLETFLGSLGS